MKMILAVTLLFLFCPLPSFGQTAISEFGHNPGLRSEKKIQASFVKLKPILGMIGEDAEFTLYVGLPHQLGDPEIEARLDAKAIAQRHGAAFQVTPKELQAGDANQPKKGFKSGGGFHSDLSLAWVTGDHTAEVPICFGCHEPKAYPKGVEVYCDISVGLRKVEETAPEVTKATPKISDWITSWRAERQISFQHSGTAISGGLCLPAFFSFLQSSAEPKGVCYCGVFISAERFAPAVFLYF